MGYILRRSRDCVGMPVAVLGLVAHACSAVAPFVLALKSTDRFWRIAGFVLAAMNVLVAVLRLLA